VPRLTDSRVQSLPSGEYTDPVAKDLQICIREARGRRVHSWLLPYKWQGAPVRIKRGDKTLSFADACKRAPCAATDRLRDPPRSERPSEPTSGT